MCGYKNMDLPYMMKWEHQYTGGKPQIIKIFALMNIYCTWFGDRHSFCDFNIPGLGVDIKRYEKYNKAVLVSPLHRSNKNHCIEIGYKLGSSAGNDPKFAIYPLQSLSHVYLQNVNYIIIRMTYQVLDLVQYLSMLIYQLVLRAIIWR